MGEPFEIHWDKKERGHYILAGLSPSALLSGLIGIKPSPTPKPFYMEKNKKCVIIPFSLFGVWPLSGIGARRISVDPILGSD